MASFQPETALAYARALAYPRRVGSPGEAAAIAEIETRLAQAGYEVERQPFEFSAGSQVATTFEILLAQILVLLTFWAWGASAVLGMLPALLLLGLLAGTGRLQRWVAAGSIAPPSGQTPTLWQRLCSRLGPRSQTVNIVGRLPGASAEPGPARGALPRLYLVAHSDSKSQGLPLAARMTLIALAGLASVVFAVLTLLRPLWPALTSLAALAGLAALLAGAPLLFLFLAGAGNVSPGALDNASGVGLVLHLAEALAQGRPDVDFTILITGAEELGVVGATAFVLLAQRHGRLRHTDTGGAVSVLNFDGIGSDGRLAMVGGGGDNHLAALVRASCVELRLPLGRLPLIGALFDHIPFAEAGCEALSLVTLGIAGRAVHTSADTADKLHVEGFRQAGEVALRVIQKMAIRNT